MTRPNNNGRWKIIKQANEHANDGRFAALPWPRTEHGELPVLSRRRRVHGGRRWRKTGLQRSRACSALILLLERILIKHTFLHLFPVSIGLAVATAAANELHVSVNGNDANDGSPQKPYRTISAAARVAQPGDVITVHEGVYRERISPPRGGESDGSASSIRPRRARRSRSRDRKSSRTG